MIYPSLLLLFPLLILLDLTVAPVLLITPAFLKPSLLLSPTGENHALLAAVYSVQFGRAFSCSLCPFLYEAATRLFINTFLLLASHPGVLHW